MFKKVLTLMLVFVGVLALAGCKPVDDPDPIDELTTLEKISEAMAQIDLPDAASSDLVFLTAGLHDVVISWESSDETVIATDGTVTIPLFTVGDKTVTITAFLTLDGETLTKTFEVEVLAATEMTDAEKAHEAAIAFNGLLSGNIISDVTLPLTGQHDSTVVWSSSHPEYVTNDGVVTRPAEDTGNVVVILTGTVTVGDASEEVRLTINVVAEEGATVFTTVADIYANAIIDEYIEFTGIVTSVFEAGYFISDGTHAIGVYKGNNDSGIAVGDEVKLKGFYAVYNTLYQFSDLTVEEVLSSGNTNPLVGTEMVKTIEEMNNLDSSDPLIHGLFYTVTGTVALKGDYDNVVLVDGELDIMVYYASDEASITALEALVGKEVTVTVQYYTNHGRDGVLVTYGNGAEGITENTLPDNEALAADLVALEDLVPAATVTGVTLPDVGPNGTAFTGWVSDNTAVLDNDGTFVALGATSVTVTFTATATKGVETATATVEVVVPLLSTVAEVNMMDLGSIVQVSGNVYEISHYGFFIEEAGYYVFVFGQDYTGDVVVGDNITLLASLSAYKGLLQASPIGDIVVNSQGNPDNVAAIPGTVEGIAMDLYPRGARVTITAEVKLEGNYDDVMLYGVTGESIKVYYRSNADEIAFVDDDDVNQGLFDQIVTLTVVLYQDGTVLFQGVTADITTGGTYDDAAKAQAVADGIDLGELGAVNVDLVLPIENTDLSATIAWATSDAVVVTDTGVITMVSGDTPSATLTATVTVGVEVVTRDIVVTLMDLNDNVPLTVTEALAMTDGDVIVVTGVVSGVKVESWGDNEVILQDPATGSAIYVDFDVTGAVVGDIVIVVGELETYTTHNNNKRQLDSGSLISIESSGNAVTVDAETDVAVIADAFADMKTYTTTLTVKSFDSYGYVFFTGSATRDLTFSASTFAPWFEHIYAVDDTVVVTFTVMDINYDNTRVVNVQLPIPTDAELVAAAKADLDIPTEATADLELPTELFGVAISWSSSNSAIGVDGVVTRPAEGQPDATGDLTATLTLGIETDTAVFPVTVPAEVPAVTYDYMETFTNVTLSGTSYAAGSFVGDNSITWNYTESRGDFDLTGQAIMLDKDGDGASLTATITGEIGALSIDYYDAYSGAAEVVIIINEGLAGEVTYTSPEFDDDGDGSVYATFEVAGIDISGEFTISIYSGGSQMVIDNLQWTEYSGT